MHHCTSTGGLPLSHDLKPHTPVPVQSHQYYPTTFTACAVLVHVSRQPDILYLDVAPPSPHYYTPTSSHQPPVNMATTFSTTTTTTTTFPQHAPYQHHAYRKSTHSQYSPTNSAINTPANISPTSPRNTHLPLSRHQGIYQPRTAIGIPAALRKTQRPASKSPPKQDSGAESNNTNPWSTNAGFGWAANDGSITPISHIGNEDMQSLYSPEPLSPVAGPITRNHWQVCYYYSLFSLSSLLAPCIHPCRVLSWGLEGPVLRTWPKWTSLASCLSVLPLSAEPRCRALATCHISINLSARCKTPRSMPTAAVRPISLPLG